ncbi:helix-turn-helix domain-containing protein [Streptomyces sp. NPDC056909]|uniref:helix-turn-helix domain-containing protein n=1 Tax=Streptomyces sp. NPDC056909 TaxID=3345963 RepID=UPI0036AEE04F
MSTGEVGVPERRETPPEKPELDLAAVKGESFSARLRRLFEMVHPLDRGEFTPTEVGRALGVSHVLVWQWKTGRQNDPKRSQMHALAEFFGVPPGYFYDDETAGKVAEELELVRAMREAGVEQIALRAAGLSPGSMRHVLDTINHVRSLEGLPNIEN